MALQRAKKCHVPVKGGGGELGLTWVDVIIHTCIFQFLICCSYCVSYSESTCWLS